MPPSLFTLYSGIGPFAAIILITSISSALTLLASWALLRLYRRAVNNAMAARAASDERLDDDHDRALGGRGARSFLGNAEAERLYRRAVRGPCRYARRYAIAGVLYALVMAVCAYYAFSQIQINPLAAAKHTLQFWFWFWMFSWPVVLTTQVVGATHGRRPYLLPSAYFLALVTLSLFAAWIPTEAPLAAGDAVMLAWSGETPLRLLAKWCVYNLAPTLLLVAFQSRRVRAVAPLVLAFMTVVSFGLLAAYVAAFYYMEVSVGLLSFLIGALGWSPRWAVIGYFTSLAAMTLLVFGLPGWWLMKRIRAGYQAKTISDQSLALDALWLIFTAFYTAMLAFAGVGWGALAVAAYIAFKFTLLIVSRFDSIDLEDAQGGPALLVLRVFALGKRSEALFDAVTRRWRYIGNVQLIAGPDLAISTVAPHRFLAFLSGRLADLFVNDAAALQRQLGAVDPMPDDDGRFRINDFFCRADIWQSVLRRLVIGTDAVMMDLRSFSETNAGCALEINELLNVVPLSRLVFVTDDDTKQEFLQQTLQKCCTSLSVDSPNSGIAAADVQSLELSSLGYAEMETLLRRLCAAASLRSPPLPKTRQA